MSYIYTSKNSEAVNMLHTVRMKYEGYTKKGVEAYILVRKLQARFGHPSDAEFKNMARDKLLKNCPVKLEQITNANNIFGPNFSGLRGKSVRTKPTRVKKKYIPIPRDFHILHKFVTLTADLMFVSGSPFLITLSSNSEMS